MLLSSCNAIASNRLPPFKPLGGFSSIFILVYFLCTIIKTFAPLYSSTQSKSGFNLLRMMRFGQQFSQQIRTLQQKYLFIICLFSVPSFGGTEREREQKVNDKLYSFGNYLAKKFSALIWLLNPLVACSCYTL